jgi:hypothetical protein
MASKAGTPSRKGVSDKLLENFVDADPVNNPEHYTSGAIECIEAIKAALGAPGYIGFLQGQIMKYSWRMGLKPDNDMLTDARKAQWYMSELVTFLSKNHDLTRRFCVC